MVESFKELSLLYLSVCNFRKKIDFKEIIMNVNDSNSIFIVIC